MPELDEKTITEQLQVSRSRPARLAYRAGGIISLGLGIIGAVLPIMPTTVFILIAAFCFSRSSPRFYRALITNKYFGPAVIQWQTSRCISVRARWYAITLIVITFSISAGILVTHVALRLMLVAVGLSLVYYLGRLPTCR